MESKLRIYLEVGAISRRYELLVPGRMKVREALPLFIQAAVELSGNAYISSGHEFLCAKRQQLLLDADATLEAQGIGNGDHLLLL